METFQKTQTFLYPRTSEKKTPDFLYWKNLEVCVHVLLRISNGSPLVYEDYYTKLHIVANVLSFVGRLLSSVFQAKSTDFSFVRLSSVE